MIERYGVTFFEPDKNHDDHRAMKDLAKVSLGDVKFPFGFRLVDEDGKTVVIPATEDERKSVLRQAFPDLAPELRSFLGCTPNSSGPGCHGGCPGMPSVYKCMRLWEETRRFFGCGCVDIS